MSSNDTVNTDPFGLWMMKPTKSGGQVWYIYNTDFNNDPQVYTESTSLEYLVHNVEDADGTRFTISATNAFKAYISTSTGYQPSVTTNDQQLMVDRGYMQNPQDWRNVEFTGQFVVFTEADDFITFAFRTGKATGSGAPIGCTGSAYLVEVHMKAGGLVRVRKKSWNTSIHNWLSGLASGFDSTKVCGWTIKILCYNTQDGKNVNVEVWLAKDNDNRFTKILSGTDTGQLNTDANVCNCTVTGQPLTWGAPFVMLGGNTGVFGFKNISIREIEGFGTTLPPVDPGGGGGTTDPGTGGGGGSGSGSGGGGTGGGGGVPVDLTPVLATPKTQYIKYGGGPQNNPLDFYVIFAGAAWNNAPPPPTSTGGGTTTTLVEDLVLATPQSSDIVYNGGLVFTAATVHFIFWGSQWNTKTTPWSKTSIMTALDKVFKSTYFEGLLQYGYPQSAQFTRLLNRRPKIGSIVINTTYAPVNNFTAIDIRNVIVDSINRGQVPDKGVLKVISPGVEPDHHIYYVIGSHNCFPATSFADASSFHYYTNLDADDELLVYAYTNDMDYVNGNSTDMLYMTYGMTHEIVEAITDPLVSGWWKTTPDPQTGDLGEISDLCSTRYNVNGTIACGYFSNQDNACIAPSTSKPTWISCPTGYTYDAATQACTKTTTTTPAPTTPTPTANTTLKTSVQNDITTVFNSNYFLPLFQYGLAKKPVLKGFVVATTPPANTITNGYTTTGLNSFIADCVAKGLVPVNKQTGPKNIAYMIIMPPAMKSSEGWVATHYSHDLSPVSVTDPNQQWFYFISVASYTSTYTEFTDSITHEFVETIANNITLNDRGYVIKSGTPLDSLVTAHGNEIADVCETDTTTPTTLNGVTVAKYWSDQDGKCIISTSTTNPTPYVSCHTGAIWSATTQTCTLQPAPGGGGTTPGGTGGGSGYKVVLANATDDDGNVPANAIDGKLDTRWSAFGKGQFLRLDFGTPKRVDKIKIAWYQGDKRSNSFEILTAQNQGDPFISKLKTDSKQGSTALQDYSIPLTNCRYVRIVGYGNTQNDWISISEVEAWGPDVASSTPGTGSGGDPGSGGVTPGGDTGGGTGTPPADDQTEVPVLVTAYNFFDTSFSVDYHKIGLCNPVE
jgi:hypothetical protein